MKRLLITFLIVWLAQISCLAKKDIPDQWQKNDNSFSITVERFRLEDKILFYIQGSKNDALFVDNKLVHFFHQPALLEFNKKQILELFGEKNTIQIEVFTKASQQNPDIFGFKVDQLQLSKRYVVSKTVRNSDNRNFYVLLFLGLLSFFAIIKLLFPVYFSFVLSSFRSTFGFDIVSEFKNGAIVFSMITSAAIFSFVWSSGNNQLSWSGLLFSFLLVLVFIVVKFLANRVLVFLLEEKDLLSGLYLDWLFNIIRVSFLLIILYVFIGILAIDLSWFYSVAPFVVVLIPTFISIISSIKNMNILPFNYLFLYLCALEILPSLILIKVI